MGFDCENRYDNFVIFLFGMRLLVGWNLYRYKVIGKYFCDRCSLGEKDLFSVRNSIV